MESQLKIENPLNILVRRRAAIGDVIMTTGVVRELKLRYGANANIDVATDVINVYRNNPHVRHVVPVEAADPARYDLYFNLDDAYELNPENHYIDSMFYRVFGRTDMDQRVELYPSPADRAAVESDLARLGDRFIAVHMRNWHWGAKNISLDVWFDVYARVFTERADFQIAVVGGPTDHAVEDHPLFVDLRGRYNDQQLKCLLDHARCFVGIDSGPFWCAAASRTRIIGLLTHLHPDRIMPVGDHVAIPTLEDCAGCNDRQARPVRQIMCVKQTYPCTNNFNTEQIAQEILNSL